MNTAVHWNPDVKLILSDVDETVADLYVDAVPEMIRQIKGVLDDGISIFFITGQGLESVQRRIVHHIPKPLRSRILIGHCSGAEVQGFTSDGNLREGPFYSVYETSFSPEQKLHWREIIRQIIDEFHLLVYPTMPVSTFVQETGKNPLAIMYEDRGPQITFEVINGYDLTKDQVETLEHDIPDTHGSYDLRIPIMERADVLMRQAKLPVTANIAGVFAVDFRVKGVSKTTAVQTILHDQEVLASVGLSPSDIAGPESIEIWGDKFSVIRGGSDRHMSEAVDPSVRSIDFRDEDPAEFPDGYNIVRWDGEKHLHEGLLEYLQTRNR